MSISIQTNIKSFHRKYGNWVLFVLNCWTTGRVTHGIHLHTLNIYWAPLHIDHGAIQNKKVTKPFCQHVLMFKISLLDKLILQLLNFEMNLIHCSCRLKGFCAYADVWTPVFYFYGINRIEISMALDNLQLY